MQQSKTSLETQSSTLLFKPGKVIDFTQIDKAVDKAGFTASEITIWAKGTPKVEPDGRLVFVISGTNQTLPVADGEEAAKLKAQAGKEITLVAKVDRKQQPPRLVLVGPEGAKPAGASGMGEMKGMGETKGMGEMKGMKGMKGM